MKLYTYIITRDYGFAPNPFGGYCTLATCKPSIRKIIEVGDWVIATGPKSGYGLSGYLFYAMKVEEKLTYNQYWNDQRFQYKKPVLNGSLKQCYGDNIYFIDESTHLWHQEDSHHSLPDGEINNRNLKNDTKAPFVLISTHFYYFGSKTEKIPKEFREDVCCKKRFPVHKIVRPKVAEEFINWLENNHEVGVFDEPIEFAKGFKRYDGF